MVAKLGEQATMDGLKGLRKMKSLRDCSTSPVLMIERGNSSSQTINEVSERIASISDHSQKTATSIPEDIIESPTKESILSVVMDASSIVISPRYEDPYNSDSFEAESVASTKSQITEFENASKQEIEEIRSDSDQRSSSKSSRKCQTKVNIKVPLSPLTHGRQRRRHSSGSDDSVIHSQTETASEQSEAEGRVATLLDQLRKRKQEADRLKREQKRLKRERLKAKEQSLISQIKAYDMYIEKTKRELEKEYEYSSGTIVRPKIKQPKVAGKPQLQNQDKSQTPVHASESEQSINLSQDDLLNKDFEPSTGSSTAESHHSEKSGFDVRSVEKISNVEDILSNVHKSNDGVSLNNSNSETSMISSDVQEAIPSTIDEEKLSDSSKGLIFDKVTIRNRHDADLPEFGILVGENIATDYDIEESVVEKESHESTQIEENINEEAASTITSISEADEEQSDKIIQIFVSQKTPSPRVNSDEIVEEQSEVVSQATEDFSVEQKKSSIEDSSSKIEEEVNDDDVGEEDGKVIDEVEEAYVPATNKVLELSESLLKDNLEAAFMDIVHIYRYRKLVKESTRLEAMMLPEEVSPKDSNIKKRVQEILLENSLYSSKDQSRMQDLLVTTYDVSSPEDSAGSTPYNSSPSHVGKDEKLLSVVDKQDLYVPERKEKEDEFAQEWFDDDYGLSNRSKEAEELRLQQLQIEQEIEQIEQQQAQTPYFYIREIPNKPPPPYTPPAQQTIKDTSVIVPSKKEEVMMLVDRAASILTEAINLGIELSSVQPGEDYFGTIEESRELDNVEKESRQIYMSFLFDLSKQIAIETINDRKEDVRLPWQKHPNGRTKLISEQEICEVVVEQVDGLFGFTPSNKKENLIMKWNKKKRDNVDQLLLKEFQEEEPVWVNYDEEEMEVKNDVTNYIMNSLLNDTVRAFQDIFYKKNKFYKTHRTVLIG